MAGTPRAQPNFFDADTRYQSVPLASAAQLSPSAGVQVVQSTPQAVQITTPRATLPAAGTINNAPAPTLTVPTVAVSPSQLALSSVVAAPPLAPAFQTQMMSAAEVAAATQLKSVPQVTPAPTTPRASVVFQAPTTQRSLLALQATPPRSVVFQSPPPQAVVVPATPRQSAVLQQVIVPIQSVVYTQQPAQPPPPPPQPLPPLPEASPPKDQQVVFVDRPVVVERVVEKPIIINSYKVNQVIVGRTGHDFPYHDPTPEGIGCDFINTKLEATNGDFFEDMSLVARTRRQLGVDPRCTETGF